MIAEREQAIETAPRRAESPKAEVTPLCVAVTHVDLPNETKGGVAHFAHYYANALAARGHEVTMFSFSPRFEECRYTVQTLPDSNRANRFRPFRFAAALARADFSRFDVVHTFGDCYLLGGCRVPHIRTFSGSARDELRSARSLQRKIFQAALIPLEEWSSRVADVSIGISENTRERLPRVSRVIPCGVDLSSFSPGEKGSTPAILFVGTSGGRKRGQWLADVFTREVLPRVPDAELWTVAEKDIEGERVVNFGRVSLEKLAELYRRAWVFCLPSTYEGFGVPYIEAMASGTAVVATPNPGAVEVLQRGKSGIVAEDAEVGASLTDLLLNTTRREELIRLGLIRADDYSWTRIVDAYESVYTQVMQAPGHSVRTVQ